MILMHNPILKRLGLALLYTLPITILGLIFITIVGAIDQFVYGIQNAGNWWILIIFGYLLSLGYVLYKDKLKAELREMLK